MVMPTAISFDPRYANRILEISEPNDIPKEWRDTPIEKFIASENFHKEIEQKDAGPQLLIGTCIEARYALTIPPSFAYVIRRASGRLLGAEFSIAYTIVKGVEHVVLIGHNDCGMTRVPEAMPALAAALTSQGWEHEAAEEFVKRHAGRHSIGDEIDALEREYYRLKKLFPKLTIAPLFVCLAEATLYLPKWYKDPHKDPDKALVSDAELLDLM